LHDGSEPWCLRLQVVPQPFDLIVHASLLIPASELQWRFSRSSGAGGQNVNKLETAVELLFHLEGSRALGVFRKQRLLEHFQGRLIDGCLRVAASDHRSQFQNRQLALQRMADLLREGLKPPEQLRRSTRPTRASVKRRLQGKKRRSDVKQNRKPPSSLQD
jgi:ribosome-associated protein